MTLLKLVFCIIVNTLIPYINGRTFLLLFKSIPNTDYKISKVSTIYADLLSLLLVIYTDYINSKSVVAQYISITPSTTEKFSKVLPVLILVTLIASLTLYNTVIRLKFSFNIDKRVIALVNLISLFILIFSFSSGLNSVFILCSLVIFIYINYTLKPDAVIKSNLFLLTGLRL